MYGWGFFFIIKEPFIFKNPKNTYGTILNTTGETIKLNMKKIFISALLIGCSYLSKAQTGEDQAGMIKDDRMHPSYGQNMQENRQDKPVKKDPEQDWEKSPKPGNDETVVTGSTNTVQGKTYTVTPSATSTTTTTTVSSSKANHHKRKKVTTTTVEKQ